MVARGGIFLFIVAACVEVSFAAVAGFFAAMRSSINFNSGLPEVPRTGLDDIHAGGLGDVLAAPWPKLENI